MTIPTPTPTLIIETMDSLLKRQASASWMSPDVIRFIEHNRLLLVTVRPSWSITLTPAGEQFISQNGEGGDHKMPKFKFKLTYQFRAVYKVQDWGQDWHDRCVAFYSSPPDYQPDGNGGSRVWNFTEDEFKHQILDVVGYLHWDGCAFDGPPPIEWAGQLNTMFREQFDLARQRFPDLPEDDYFQLLGVAQLSPNGAGWIKTDLPVTDP